MQSFANKSINKDIPIPLYYQLKKILFEYITKHHDDVNSPIPTEIELSNHFNISRPTVRQAINELVVEGHLYRIKGKGTFVSKPKINQDFLLKLESFNSEMKSKGFTPSTKILSVEVIKSDDKISNALNVGIDSDIIKLSRLRFADMEPIVFVETYLPHQKCSNLTKKDLERESLYALLENDYGLCVSKVMRNLEAVIAGEFEAELLQIEKGSPIQYIESIAYLDDGSPIEYSLAKYRGDRNKFTFELKR